MTVSLNIVHLTVGPVIILYR